MRAGLELENASFSVIETDTHRIVMITDLDANDQPTGTQVAVPIERLAAVKLAPQLYRALTGKPPPEGDGSEVITFDGETVEEIAGDAEPATVSSLTGRKRTEKMTVPKGKPGNGAA